MEKSAAELLIVEFLLANPIARVSTKGKCTVIRGPMVSVNDYVNGSRDDYILFNRMLHALRDTIIYNMYNHV